MTNKEDDLPDADWEQAISQRLARLRTMPVDLTALETRIGKSIPRPHRTTLRHLAWVHPVRSVAASIAILAIITAALIASSGGPVLASAQQMAQVHEDLVAGRMPAMRVNSIDAANKALAAQSPGSPEMPDVPGDHVMACCMRDVKGKRVACVLMDSGGTPVTMTVANGAEMRLPNSPTISRDGVAYHVQSVNDLNMVMAQRQGRWICVIGRLPAERLIDTVVKLQF
jgi:hypothetical protein